MRLFLLFFLTLVACRQDHAPPPTGERSSIALTYLGVAGWQLDAGPTTILVDPYYSRPDLDAAVKPDPAAIAARAPAQLPSPGLEGDAIAEALAPALELRRQRTYAGRFAQTITTRSPHRRRQCKGA